MINIIISILQKGNWDLEKQCKLSKLMVKWQEVAILWVNTNQT
jgi:hypothetical protein